MAEIRYDTVEVFLFGIEAGRGDSDFVVNKSIIEGFNSRFLNTVFNEKFLKKFELLMKQMVVTADCLSSIEKS